MSPRRRFAFALSVAVLMLLAEGAVLYPVRRAAGGRTAPYWRRTGFLSDVLQQLPAGARGLQSIHVPEGFVVEEAAGPGLVSYPMFASFDDRGRLFVCESAGKNVPDDEMQQNPEMRIRLLEDTNGDGVFDRGVVFADKITMAMGAVWHKGSLYVGAPPDILKLEDTDGDGVADRREVLLTGWPLHSNGTTLHGPFLGPDGWMYLTYNLGHHRVRTREGAMLEGPGGRVWRFRPDGTGLEWFVGGGFDNGIEIVFTPAGETLGTMTYYTNPKLGLRDALLHFVEGGVYPKVTPIVNKYKRTGDLMPAMTKFARIAPAGLLLYRGPSFGPAWQGNLFSAQFNPHRVQRHILERDGATFRTTDEDFLTSSDPDFHVTDVAEDADGSLLVVETGAWYLHSCPVSRIAKPQLRGAIYRVRRRGAPPVEDPWGKTLRIESLPPGDVARLLGDPRPAVRDKAAGAAVEAGEAAVAPLARLRESHSSPDTRAAAVFALGRIGSTRAALSDPNGEAAVALARSRESHSSPHTRAAAEGVRAALSDPNLVVRVAAARMAGLSRDPQAVERLMQMVRQDAPAARRQAATALGQIGDARAVAALLDAAADPDDRFVEHAIIYSLITLRAPGPAAEAMKSSSPRVRQAALIALDQMDGAPLSRQQLASALHDSDPALRRAALWVATHHPDWSSDVLQMLRTRLRGPALPPQEEEAVRETLRSYCQVPDAQQLMADLSLFDAIEQCPVKEFPEVWLDRLRQELRGSEPARRARVVALARARQLAALADDLERIGGDQAEAADLRAAALGALVGLRPGLSDASFRFLLRLLGPATEADLRQSSAQALGRAKLTDPQLLALARDHLARADPLILPNLLEAFRAARTDEVGSALMAALIGSPHAEGGIAAARIPDLLRNFSSAVQAAGRPLLARIEKEKASRADRLISLQPLLAGGDPGRGRQVFFGKKAGCAGCHTIMTEGAEVGPDLTGVGAIRTGFDLLEAIVFPSASFVPGHEVYRVETAREVYTGVMGDSTPDAIVVISGPHDRVRIPRKAVVSSRPSPVSLMPDGFAQNLTPAELSDLLAFLQGQKYRTTAAPGVE